MSGDLLRVFKNIDIFRSVPDDFIVATRGGFGLTIFSALACFLIFVCELQEFLTSRLNSHLEVDSNTDALLRINFDVSMLDVPCEYLTVGVWDTFGTSRSNITTNIMRTRLSHDGADSSQLEANEYTDEELTEIEYNHKKLSPEEVAEYNADWVSSSDKAQHRDFRGALEAHDFTFVLFCMPDIGPCKLVIPVWGKFTANVNGLQGNTMQEFRDANNDVADVRALQVNCADDAFEEVCLDQKVRSFPNIRLYRRSISKYLPYKEIDFEFPRSVLEQARMGAIVELKPKAVERLSKAVMDIAVERVSKFHLHTNTTIHPIFNTGCRLNGHVEVPRVPSTMHLEAATWDRTLNPAFTNVSHIVHHLSFGQSTNVISDIPQDFRSYINPLDGKQFLVDKFHIGPHHYIKILHTRFEHRSNKETRFYQQTHQWSFRRFPREETPKARFSFDLAPLEVVVSRKRRAWYDFVTSIFAMIGGTWAVATMTAGWMNRICEALGKS